MTLRRIITATMAAFLAGCDGAPPQAAAPATQPSSTPEIVAADTQPVVVVFLETPATAPTSQPSQSVLNIGQKDFSFPQAVLRFSQSHGHLGARLTTDDPAAAIEANYHGNSFDMIMADLNVGDASQIDQAVWKFTPPISARPEETAMGIFLDGQRRRLHIQDVTARFQKDGENVIVDLSGWFSLYEGAGTDRSFARPPRVFVQGRLEAIVAR